jgi:hypothetical protein
MAIPNHPWTKATRGAAAVRIAMTVAERGRREGVLREVVHETGLDSDNPQIGLMEVRGLINPNLTIGVDVAAAVRLSAGHGICHDGVKLHGRGFIVRPAEAVLLGLSRRQGVEDVIRPYLNGRDLNQHSRGMMVIDLFGFNERQVRQRFSEIYQHLLATVKPARDAVSARSSTRDAEEYAQLWWLFGKPRQELRPALVALSRFVATVDTASHRIFQFIPVGTVCDDKIVIVASQDAFHLGVLSSRVHLVWCLAQRTRLGQGDDPVYVKIRCFSPFPFPDLDGAECNAIGEVAEDLDVHRKRVLAEHPHLTLTGLYNVLEKLRAGANPAALSAEDRRTFDDGLVLILKELHDKLDAAVAEAYGWPADLSDNDILTRLVALNKERAQEEARGIVRWLRPDYQIPRFGTAAQKAELDLVGGAVTPEAVPATGPKPLFPTDDMRRPPPSWRRSRTPRRRSMPQHLPRAFVRAAVSSRRSPRCSARCSAWGSSAHRTAAAASACDGRRSGARFQHVSHHIDKPIRCREHRGGAVQRHRRFRSGRIVRQGLQVVCLRQKSPQLGTEPRIVVRQTSELHMDATVGLRFAAGTHVDQRLCRMKYCQIRGAPCLVTECDRQDRLAVRKALPRLGQIPPGLRCHRSTPSRRSAAISGDRSCQAPAPNGNACTNAPIWYSRSVSISTSRSTSGQRSVKPRRKTAMS